MGFFDKPFDFNHDGKLSGFERAARAAIVTSILTDEDDHQNDRDSYWDDDDSDDDDWDDDDSDDDDSDDDFEDDDVVEKRKILLDAGLDPDELEWMDEDERNEVLEDMGLDPDDFEF